MTNKRKGFTLVEVIVVLVILAILAAVMIPSMTGWIDKAKEKRLLVACRTCVNAAQTLASEAYGVSGTEVTLDAAKVIELAGVDGSTSNIFVDNNTASVDMLTYTEGSDSVTYERLPEPHYTFGADTSGYTTQANSFTGFVNQWMQDNNRTKLDSTDKSNLYKAYYASHSAVKMSEDFKKKMLDAHLLPSLKNKDLYWWSYPVTDAQGNLAYTVTFANERENANWWTDDNSSHRTSISSGYVVVVDGKTYVRTGTAPSADIAPGTFNTGITYPEKKDLIDAMIAKNYIRVN